VGIGFGAMSGAYPVRADTNARRHNSGVFTDAFPIITTPDLGRLLGFYRDALGGAVEYRFPPEGDPVYVALNIGSGHLGIGAAPDAETGAGTQRFSLWVYAESCDEAVERLRAAD
jgi:lactoylglutathione lyase